MKNWDEFLVQSNRNLVSNTESSRAGRQTNTPTDTHRKDDYIYIKPSHQIALFNKSVHFVCSIWDHSILDLWPSVDV